MPEDTRWFDPDATTFGDRLTGAREGAGLSVEDLARRLGVKPKSVRAWEDDRSEPRANRISMLAGITNVSLVWLMSGSGPGPSVVGEPPDPDLLRDVERLRRDAVLIVDRLRALEQKLRDRDGAEA